jgi:hypothetical protein
MKTWHLECVDRKTGKETVERFPALDDAEAFRLAADRGLMVGKVLRVEAPPPPPAALVAPPSRNLPDTTAMSLGGLVLLAGGVVALLIGFGMDTSVGSMENIGKLNRQTCTVIVGAALFLSGVIVLALVRVCAEVSHAGKLARERVEQRGSAHAAS